MFSGIITKTKTSVFVTVILILTLCFNAGCSGGVQNSAVPASSSDSGGSTQGGGTQAVTTVTGVIVDGDSLEPLNNVTVSIGTLTATTDPQGNYTLTGVPAGAQTIRCTCNDYSDESQSVQVTEGQTCTQDIGMSTTIDDWLELGQAYNWQVEAVQADGTVVSGPVWSFSADPTKSRSVKTVEVPQAVDRNSAQKVAETFLASSGQSGSSIASMEPILSASGVTLAYAFILSPAGYIIVPASSADVLPPVLAYSFTSSFSTHSASSLAMVKMIRNDIILRLAALQQKAHVPASFQQKNRSLWESHLSGKVIASESTARTVYGPHLYDTKWGQGDPYNKLCPWDDVNDAQCLVGCPATAFSQILNYWQAPTSITFTADDDYTTRTRKINIKASSASFSGLSYNSGYPTDDNKAKISYALGVLGKMNYTSKNSTAYTLTMGKSMTRLGYKQPRIKRYSAGDTLDTEPIISDLKTKPYGYPVVMSISSLDDNGDYDGGHAIVCDGYNDSTDKFHLNMGWYGKKDGWYSLPSGMPSDYNAVKGYVYGLVPATRDSSAEARTARSAAPENPYPKNGETKVELDDELLWDECDNAVSYNCYLWKAGSSKPSAPTFSKLPYAAASSCDLEAGAGIQ
ncbi:MAG: C10 family peptidase [Vulcanimicrobiota bacterium]